MLSFLVLFFLLQKIESTEFSNSISVGEIREFSLTDDSKKTKINVTFSNLHIEYEVRNTYVFFIPDVDVICQCMCTSEKANTCDLDRECALLNNGTTSCTNHITVGTDLSTCSKFYKLCCQVYFTKTRMMKSFKALHLKYHQTLLTIQISSKSHDGKLSAYNITIPEYVKNILVNDDMVLRILDNAPVHHISEGWYFIEDGSNELLYSDAINAKDDENLNKIGWFQYDILKNEVSQVSRRELEKHFQVRLLDCHSDPPKYEWKLNATHYVTKGSLDLPKNVEKISEMYNDISKISANLKENKIEFDVISSSSVSVNFSSAKSYPFVFTSSIKERNLNLSFAKGSGNFNVIITSSHLTKKLLFPTSSSGRNVSLPSNNYKSYWICIYQKELQLCQVPSFDKEKNKLVKPSNYSQITELNNDTSLNKSVPLQTETLSKSAMIGIIVGIILPVLALLSYMYIWLRRRKMQKKRGACDESELECLSNTRQSDVLNVEDDLPSTKTSEFPQETCLLLNDLQKEMQEILKKNFNKLMMPRSLWLKKKKLLLEDLFVELTMKLKNEKGEEEKKTIEKEAVFEERGNIIPRRILIEGNPGYGKTTLLSKFLSDWSREEKYITDRFDLVFVSSLRHYKGKLTDIFFQNCESLKEKVEEVLEAIKAIEERVLLLLDGFDEIPDMFKGSLLPLINRKNYKKMVVVITCRTGFTQMENTSAEIYETVLSDFQQETAWDKRIQIKGISPEKRSEFLHKYLNIEDMDLREKISQTRFEMNDLYECPLFLILLAVLVQEKEVRQINNTTELYKTIFNFVINRDLEKISKNVKEFDLFDLKSPSDEFGCRDLLINFGRLCLEKIKNHSLIFEEKELVQCSGRNTDNNLIFRLGLVTKQISFSYYEEKEHYEPIHKSFLEFSAAFFLSSLDDIDKEIKELLLQSNIWPKRDQLIYPFLGGLLNSNAFKLFNALSPFKSLISIFNDKDQFDYHYPYNVESVLLEIPQTEEILASLEKLSIGNWEWIEYREVFHEWLVGLLQNVEKRLEDSSLLIPDNLDIIDCLSQNSKINTVTVKFGYFEFEEKIKMKRKSIRCKNLIIPVLYKINFGFPMILKEILSTVQAEKIWLKITYSQFKEEKITKAKDDFIKFYQEVIGKISQQHFYHLSLHKIPLTLFSLVSPFLEELITTKKLKYGINISFANGKLNDAFRKEFGSFEEIVTNSHLKAFGIGNVSSHDSLPFPATFTNNERTMTFIGLKGLFGDMNVDQLKSFPVEHFHCTQFKSEEDIFLPKLMFKFTTIKKLSCTDVFISKLGACNSIMKWKGLKTIDRLDLLGDQIEDEESFLRGISLFKSLREISLIHFQDNELIIDLVSHVTTLKKISFLSSEYLPRNFLEKLFVTNKEHGGKAISLDEFTVEGLTGDDFSSMDLIKFLEKCFLAKVFLNLIIVNTNADKLQNLLKYFFSKENFVILSEWNDLHHYTSGFPPNIAEIPILNHELRICLKENVSF